MEHFGKISIEPKDTCVIVKAPGERETLGLYSAHRGTAGSCLIVPPRRTRAAKPNQGENGRGVQYGGLETNAWDICLPSKYGSGQIAEKMIILLCYGKQIICSSHVNRASTESSSPEVLKDTHTSSVDRILANRDLHTTTLGINIYTFILARCSLSALEPFFGHFSAARPRLVARLAPSDSPRPRGPCPRAGPPSHSTSTPNERVLSIIQLAKLSFNHPSVVLTGHVFQFFMKKYIYKSFAAEATRSVQ